MPLGDRPPVCQPLRAARVSEALDFATQSRSGEVHAPTPDQSFRHAHLVYDEPQPEGARALCVRIPRTDPEAR